MGEIQNRNQNIQKSLFKNLINFKMPCQKSKKKQKKQQKNKKQLVLKEERTEFAINANSDITVQVAMFSKYKKYYRLGTECTNLSFRLAYLSTYGELRLVKFV